MQLGAIADDYTGASDLCSSLRRQGCRCHLSFGVPLGGKAAQADVAVVALKSRTGPAADAVACSRAALRALREGGARQIFFKYCSTFDSTEAGNIGPVLDALSEDLGAETSLVCPTHSEQGRTVYLGHLFVGGELLSDSPMREHPLTPMRDSSVVRLLARQTTRPVTLVPITVVEQGAGAVADAIAARTPNDAYVVADAYAPRHLATLAEACEEMPLVSGGAGLGGALGERIGRRIDGRTGSQGADDRVGKDTPDSSRRKRTSPTAILAGSSSQATRRQVEAVKDVIPSFRIDPLAVASGASSAEAIAEQALACGGPAVLVYASAPPEEVAAVQRELGAAQASALIEEALAGVARLLAGAGVRRFVAAGGESAAAVVQGLGITDAEVGEDLEPGIPWLVTAGPDPLLLALKSGNFGSKELFARAVGR